MYDERIVTFGVPERFEVSNRSTSDAVFLQAECGARPSCASATTVSGRSAS